VKLLTTERLRMRPLVSDDLSFFARVHADPEVARFLSSGKPRSYAETRTWLDKQIVWESEHGVSQMCVLSRDGERHLGRCGLSIFEVEREDHPARGELLRAYWGPGSAPAGVPVTRELEIGYLIDSEAWGVGYATEAARCMRDYAFEELGAPRVMALIHPRNPASVRVAEKAGLARYDVVDVFGRRFERYLADRGD